ncbi:protein KRTCAP2 homolog [Anoplophora glabripennis]|uniref:protein KRTCAP2 homolog n=1 Tax=Anoplophora glabripennis TaxID=217634 RepID=UPI000874C065|nr:protein KRTCAP2 homolog [Anoplophora glabripennis]
MAVTTGTSFVLAAISSVLIFSGMQMFRPWFSSSQLHTLLGGYLGSLLFILCLTALGNLETCLFGKSFQVKIFPEVSVALLVSLFASATIHRVCGSSCFLISLCALYYLNKYSQRVYAVPTAPVVVQTGKKKKNTS